MTQQKNVVLEQYIQRITKELVSYGLSLEEAIRVITELDETLHREITNEIIDTLAPEEREELDQADENMSEEAFLDIVGFTKKDIETRYLHKLEEYMTDLPEHIIAIKAEQLSRL